MVETVVRSNQELAAQVLARLVRKQKVNLTSGGVEGVSTDSRKHLLVDFRKTRVFGQRYSQLVNVLSLPRTDLDLGQVRQDFSGAIFQDMAFMYLVQNKPESSTLLSPQATLKLYSNLYPNAQRISHPFGCDSLQGISVPDGVIVNGGGKVTAVCEYTLNGSQLNFGRKITNLGFVKKDFADIFGDAKLIFLTPTFDSHSSGIERVELPFSHKQFRDFIDYLFKDYRADDDSASLREIQDRVREQVKNIKEAQAVGKITYVQELFLAKIAPYVRSV